MCGIRWGVACGLLTVFIAGNAPGQTTEVEAPVRVAVVYQSDFANGIDRAWSRRSREVTPKQRIPFIGQFGNETATLDLQDLPQHAALRVSFELFIIHTWDGSGRNAWGSVVGPDFWTMELDGGPALLRGTFSALPDDPGFKPSGKTQSWPRPIPGQPLPMGTGAAGITDLGYVFTFRPEASFPMDVRYVVSIEFGHTASSEKLNFTGAGLQGINDEGWGLANVKVEALTALPAVSDSQLSKAWQAVIADEPVAAQRAFWTLVAGGDRTVDLIAREVRSLQVDLPAARAAVDTLMNNGMSVEPLLLELIAFGPPIEPLLREKLSGSRPGRQVLHDILRHMEATPIEAPLRQRAAAASRVLQVIDSDAARALHQRLLEAPPLRAEPGTPEYDADWRERFNRVYSLAPRENLKYIPSPLIEERERFLADRKSRGIQRTPELPPSITGARFMRFVLPDGNDIPNDEAAVTVEFGSAGLERVTRSMGLSVTPTSPVETLIIGTEALKDLDLSGDWVWRQSATADELLEGLQRILSERTGKTVSFEDATIPVPAIRFTGTFRYEPLEEGEADVVQIYSDRLDDEPGHSSFHSSAGGMLSHLSDYVKQAILIEIENPREAVQWRIHNSASLSRDKEDYEQRLGMLLHNLQAQTSLTFQPGEVNKPCYRLVVKEKNQP